MKKLLIAAVLSLVISTTAFAKNEFEVSLEPDSDVLLIQESIWFTVFLRNASAENDYMLKYFDVSDNVEGFSIKVNKDGVPLQFIGGETAEPDADSKDIAPREYKLQKKDKFKFYINIKKLFGITEIGDYTASISFKDENGDLFESNELKFKIEDADESKFSPMYKKLDFKTKRIEFELLNYEQDSGTNYLFYKAMSMTNPDEVVLLRRLAKYAKGGILQEKKAGNDTHGFIIQTEKTRYHFIVINMEGRILDLKRINKVTVPRLGLTTQNKFYFE